MQASSIRENGACNCCLCNPIQSTLDYKPMSSKAHSLLLLPELCGNQDKSAGHGKQHSKYKPVNNCQVVAAM